MEYKEMRMNYVYLKKEIERCGVGNGGDLKPEGLGWTIGQSPHELATFLAAVWPIETFLEIGTGPAGGLSRFLAEVLGVRVTTVDGNNYGLGVPGVRYVILPAGESLWIVEGQYDVVFLDGPHNYEGVACGYEHYRDCSKIVAIHDIEGLRGCPGVRQFWQQVSRTKTGRMRRGFCETIDVGIGRVGIGWRVQ